ncbi:MAG: tetratricopeptide repeat protein, partial [Candidatus Omnitrophica bacterium]|nr:tetratricopeptide repeat protein [Candidatus Omnitrophota bacterium]
WLFAAHIAVPFWVTAGLLALGAIAAFHVSNSMNQFFEVSSEGEENFPEAEKYYKKVMQEYTGTQWNSEATLSLGHLYWRQGYLDKAEEYFNKTASSEEPIALKTKLYLAKIEAQKGNEKEAMKIYDELSASPSSIAKIAVLEKAFLFKENNDYKNAIALFKKAINDGVDSPEIRFNLGQCFEKINKDDDALKEYLTLIYSFSDQSHSVKAYFRIAKIYEKKKNYDAAKEIYEKIMNLNTEEGKIARTRLEALQAK